MQVRSKTLLCLLKILISFLFLPIWGCHGSIASIMIANSYSTDERYLKDFEFSSTDEVQEYADNYLYFAYKLTDEEWKGFYKKYPKFWKEIQAAKSYTFYSDFNRGYTAYAFKWALLQQRDLWDKQELQRLQDNYPLPGDNIHKVVFSLGPPTRIIWDNDFEILIFKDDTAAIFENGVFSRRVDCKDCSRKNTKGQTPQIGFKELEFELDDEAIIKKFSQKPKQN